MGQLFTQKYPNNIRTVSGLINIVKQDDVVLLCDTSLGAVVIELLSIPENYWSTQYKLYIIDKSNNASAHSITVVAPLGFKINASSTAVISTNGGSLYLSVCSNTDYIGVAGGSGGGVGTYNTVQDEGISLPSRTTMNFVGKGVTATDDGTKTVVTVNGGIIALTNASMIALVVAGTVIEGQLYQITDPLNADGGVIVQGIANNGITTTAGSGIFLNADYQGTGDYSGVSGYTGFLGIWSVNVLPVVVGKVVIWYNRHYKNLTGVWGTDPTLDTTNWQLLPKTITNGYKRVFDFVRYDLYSNKVVYRADANGNEVDFFEGAKGTSALRDFQWGRSVVMFNKVLGGGLMVATNSSCSYFWNVVTSGGEIKDTTPTPPPAPVPHFGLISNNSVTSSGQILMISCYGTVQGNNVASGGTINLKCNIDFNSGIYNNNCFSNSKFEFNGTVINTTIASCTTTQGGLFGFTNPLTNTIIGTTEVSNNSILNATISTFNMEQCEVNDEGLINLTSGSVFLRKKYRTGYSNWEQVLDLTNPSIFSANTLTIPTAYAYVGIFTTSGSGLTINKILNMPSSHKCKFLPKPTENTSFTHTLVASAVSGNLLCDVPSSTNLITGRLNGSDFIEYELSGDLNVRTNLVLLA
ncbi:MAG: hypothetical protein WCI04_00070 [archaeon]